MPLTEILNRSKLWTGRLRDREGEWFLVWAPDAAEAQRFVTAALGDPLPGSITEIKDPNGICISFAPEAVAATGKGGPGQGAYFHATKFIPNLRVERQIAGLLEASKGTSPSTTTTH